MVQFTNIPYTCVKSGRKIFTLIRKGRRKIKSDHAHTHTHTHHFSKVQRLHFLHRQKITKVTWGDEFGDFDHFGDDLTAEFTFSLAQDESFQIRRRR